MYLSIRKVFVYKTERGPSSGNPLKIPKFATDRGEASIGGHRNLVSRDDVFTSVLGSRKTRYESYARNFTIIAEAHFVQRNVMMIHKLHW